MKTEVLDVVKQEGMQASLDVSSPGVQDATAPRSRSRSRRLEQISRQICGFARHAHRRPPGLIVGDDGCILLSSLMASWGHQRELSENMVMDAVQRHMYHEDCPEEQRFSILEAERGQSLRIKVMPKRHKRKGDGMRPRYPLMLTNGSVRAGATFDRDRHERRHHYYAQDRDERRNMDRRRRNEDIRRARSKDREREMVEFGIRMYRMGRGLSLIHI